MARASPREWLTPDDVAKPKYWNETRQQPETHQRLAALRLLGRNDTSHARKLTPLRERRDYAVHWTRTASGRLL